MLVTVKNVFIPDENGVTFMSKKFVVKDGSGKIIFKSEAEEANISAKKLNIQSKHGSGESIKSFIQWRFLGGQFLAS